MGYISSVRAAGKVPAALELSRVLCITPRPAYISVVLAAQLMHRLHQRGRIVRIGELRNAMPQIKHMAAAVTVASQYSLCLGTNNFRRGK